MKSFTVLLLQVTIAAFILVNPSFSMKLKKQQLLNRLSVQKQTNQNTTKLFSIQVQSDRLPSLLRFQQLQQQKNSSQFSKLSNATTTNSSNTSNTTNSKNASKIEKLVGRANKIQTNLSNISFKSYQNKSQNTTVNKSQSQNTTANRSQNSNQNKTLNISFRSLNSSQNSTFAANKSQNSTFAANKSQNSSQSSSQNNTFANKSLNNVSFKSVNSSNQSNLNTNKSNQTDFKYLITALNQKNETKSKLRLNKKEKKANLTTVKRQSSQNLTNQSQNISIAKKQNLTITSQQQRFQVVKKGENDSKIGTPNQQNLYYKSLINNIDNNKTSNNTQQNDKQKEKDSKSVQDTIKEFKNKTEQGEAINFEAVQMVETISQFGHEDLHRDNSKMVKGQNYSLIGKESYKSEGITYDESPRVLKNVYMEQLTQAARPMVVEEHYSLWHSSSPVANHFKDVRYGNEQDLQAPHNIISHDTPVTQVSSLSMIQPQIDPLQGLENPLKSQYYQQSQSNHIQQTQVLTQQ